MYTPIAKMQGSEKRRAIMEAADMLRSFGAAAPSMPKIPAVGGVEQLRVDPPTPSMNRKRDVNNTPFRHLW